MHTSGQCEAKQYDLSSSHCAHYLTLQRIHDSYETFHGEGDNKPNRTETSQIANERKELTEIVKIVDVHIEKIQPLHEEAKQKAGITDGQGSQVETRGQFA